MKIVTDCLSDKVTYWAVRLSSVQLKMTFLLHSSIPLIRSSSARNPLPEENVKSCDIVLQQCLKFSPKKQKCRPCWNVKTNSKKACLETIISITKHLWTWNMRYKDWFYSLIKPIHVNLFLAVQNRSMGDLVPCLLACLLGPLPLTIRVFRTLQSDLETCDLLGTVPTSSSFSYLVSPHCTESSPCWPAQWAGTPASCPPKLLKE